MGTRISVFNSPELQGLIVSMKSFPRELNTEIRKATRGMVDPVWRAELRKRAATQLEQRVLSDTGRVQVSNQNVTLQSAGVGRAIGGRLKPVDLKGAAEFGADREKVTTYQRTSPNGVRHSVTRHTQRQFSPRRKTGYVVFPTLAVIIPRIAALWVQTTVRTFYESIERNTGG